MVEKVDPVCLPEDVVVCCVLSFLGLDDARAFLVTAKEHSRSVSGHPVFRQRSAVEDIKNWYRERRLLRLEGEQVWVRMRAGLKNTLGTVVERDDVRTFRNGYIVRVRPSTRPDNEPHLRSSRTGFALSPTKHIDEPVRFFDTLLNVQRGDFHIFKDTDYINGGSYVDWIPWEMVSGVAGTLNEVWDS